MTGFIETPRFPDEIAAWAVGGRGFQTITTDTYGGNEYRNATWAQARGVYDISEALRETNPNARLNFKALRNMFRVCMGQEYAFRFKDFQDHSDEGGGIFKPIAGSSTTFQMYKHYAVSPLSYDQIVQKPCTSPAVVITGGVSPVLDYTTGIVTVVSGTPTAWVGEFDVPVRFAEDMPNVGLDNATGAMYNWQSLKLIEVRNPG